MKSDFKRGMRRKIIKQKSAYTLTLPVKWVREHNLKGKDEIEIDEEAHALVIHSEKKPKTETVSLTLEESTLEYYRIMVENHYLKGFDVLNFKYTDSKALPVIQKVVSNLIGFEIVEQRKDFCKIAATTQPSTEQFSTLLNRCFNIISYTQNTVKEDISKLSFPHFFEIEGQSNDARRFLLFCTRALHKTNIANRRDESFMHLLLERLILIEHSHYYLYKKIYKIKNPKVRDEVKHFYNKSCEMFNLFREMFYKKELKNFTEINKDWEEMYFQKGHKLFEKCTKAESIIIFHSMQLSKLMFLVAQPNLALQKV